MNFKERICPGCNKSYKKLGAHLKFNPSHAKESQHTETVKAAATLFRAGFLSLDSLLDIATRKDGK